MPRTKQTPAPAADPGELKRLRDENKDLRSRLEQIAELAGGDAAGLDDDDDDDLDDEEEEDDDEEADDEE